MTRLVCFIYGLVCYLAFFATFLYLIGFVGNLPLPKTIDSGTPASPGETVAVDLALVALFGLQHSVMARPGFKRWWTRFMPPAIERSSYVLLASLTLCLLFWRWLPSTQEVWHLRALPITVLLWVLFALGWVVVLTSTYLINHFDLFGLRQVYLNLKNRGYAPIGFRTPFLYRIVRHPLMLGFLISFWAAPVMTRGHLLFASAMTAYVLIALQLEERDLSAYFGEPYRTYRHRVAMLLPWRVRRGA